MIIVRRIDDALEQSISWSQHAHSQNKSSEAVILTHKILFFSASIQKDSNPCLFISLLRVTTMSKAFDTRSQLLYELLSDVISQADIGLFETLFAKTTPTVCKHWNEFHQDKGFNTGEITIL